ncbi:MAG TPA: hypothetical protein PLN21_16130 [Gemmatales bacterium]|nr:hypothetical protein [Gemmatales bacterium]
MKALWNNLFVPALVVALGFSAVNVHADDHPHTGSSHGTGQPANHQTSSPAKSTSGKASSSPTKTTSAKPEMGTSKPSGGMKKDTTPAGNKTTTNPKKDTTGSAKGTSSTKDSKKDTTSSGSKPTTSTSKKESPWGGNKKDSDWGGYGGTGSVDSKGMPTDSKKTDSKKDSPWGDNVGKGKTDSKTKPSKDNKGNTSSSKKDSPKKDSPWGEQTGKGSKTTKPGKDSYPASTQKMDPCPKEMPKYKTGGHCTQEQCAPKWNTCASYHSWSSCPDQWHVKFHNTYCLPTNYCFWQKKYYDARCGCYTYYDSYSSGWYYYEPVVKCYIPVSYCEQYEVERTETLEEVDACEVEVPVCETVRNYRVLPVKPACEPYTYGRHGH